MYCSTCHNNTLHRQRRRFWHRLWLNAIYECDSCGRREAVYRLDIGTLFSLAACCPKCGNARLKKCSKLDHIELIYKAPFSYWQRFLGAPLYYCFPCRLQFFDFRSPRS